MNNRGSIVLDYNAIINAIPKPWLDWISANKQTTELEIDQVYLKKPTDLLKLIVNKDKYLSIYLYIYIYLYTHTHTKMAVAGVLIQVIVVENKCGLT